MSTEIATVEQVQERGMELVSQAEEIAVRDASTFHQAGLFLRTVAGYLKQVGEIFDPMVLSAHHAHKVAVEQRRKMTEPAETATRLVKTEMTKYEQAERQRVAEEQRKAEVERRRLEDEARLAVAVSLEQQGKSEAAARALTAPVTVPVFTPPVLAVPKVDGVSFRDNWTFVVTDPTLVPREYLMLDEQKIRAVVRAMKGETNIPGVEARNERISSVKA
jgi:hypothetical protein